MINFEKYMIPAEEGQYGQLMSQMIKPILGMAIVAAAISAPVRIANKKKEEAEALLKKKQDEEKAKKKEQLRAQIKSKYGYDLNGEYNDAWKSFVKKIYAKILNDIRKAVAAYNKNDQYIEELRKKYLKDYEVSSPDKLTDYELEDYNEIKRGLFICDEEGPLTFRDDDKSADAYICIIPGQDFAMCFNTHWDIAEVLKTKYADLVAYGFVSFTNGEGDEGCIYLDFASK